MDIKSLKSQASVSQNLTFFRDISDNMVHIVSKVCNAAVADQITTQTT